jgi:hypothetical protein
METASRSMQDQPVWQKWQPPAYLIPCTTDHVISRMRCVCKVGHRGTAHHRSRAALGSTVVE